MRRGWKDEVDSVLVYLMCIDNMIYKIYLVYKCPLLPSWFYVVRTSTSVGDR